MRFQLRRLPRLLAHQRSCPECTQHWQQGTVYTVVTRNSPGRDDQDGDHTRHQVRAHCAPQQIVQIHHDTEEGRDPRQRTYQQAQTNQNFAKGDDGGKSGCIRQYDMLQKRRVSVLHCWMRSRRPGQRTGHKAGDCTSLMASKDPGTSAQLLEGRYDNIPLVLIAIASKPEPPVPLGAN